MSAQKQEGMSGNIRPAQAADVPQLVALSEQKRAEYPQHQPVFWRQAAGATEKQTPYFERQVAGNRTIALVYEQDGTIGGFIIGTLMDAPPVYDPGGPVCTIDDFTVGDATEWPRIGRALLDEVTRAAKAREAVLVIVVTGHHDEPKRAMLAASGCTVASEWWVGRI